MVLQMNGNARKKKTQVKQESKTSLPILFPDTAGIDIGSRSHFVAVPADRDQNPVREFLTFTGELRKMVSWLKECKIKTIVMESTGVYWIPAFEMLESNGFDVKLVNARYTKNVGAHRRTLSCR